MALPPSVHKAAERLNTWFGLYTVMAALFTWLGSQLEGLRPYGWPEAILFGVVMSGFVALIASAFMVAYRKFRPMPAAAPPSAMDTKVGYVNSAMYVVPNEPDMREKVDRLADAVRNLREMAEGLDHREKIASIDSHIQDIDRSIKDLSEAARNAERTILHLVDFATHQAVAASLDKLIFSAPLVLPDEDLNEETRSKHLDYLGTIRSQLAGTYRGQSVANILQLAEQDAESTIEMTPIERRNPADPIRYRRWAIANRQVAAIVTFLRSQKREIDERIVGYRSALSEELSRRSNA